jgi:pimeloyl-ACP methyl ester carboxylesterase
LFSKVSPNTLSGQNNTGHAWEATNWNGVCDKLTKIAKPTLVMTGTDDNSYEPDENALIIAGKIPGAWLVQIKDAGHALPWQYPDNSIECCKHFFRPQQALVDLSVRDGYWTVSLITP